jgi:cytidylate kinase
MHKLPLGDQPAPETAGDLGESPLHGFQGDRGRATPPRTVPAGLSIALSREAGARGGSIARRAGRLLGWQVYDQELLEYMAQDATVRQGVAENLSRSIVDWVETRLQELLQTEELGRQPFVAHLARVMLVLGAQGNVVLLGRGAGCILPADSTLNVRVVAPLQDRIAYMSQWLRLTEAEAAERVRLRDQRRAEFVETHFHRRPDDVHQYDLLLNSSLLGEELCADLIIRAAQARASQWGGRQGEMQG